MKKIYILLITLMAFSLAGKAQMLNVNYQIGIPFGKTNDFISKASFRGADIEYHKFLGQQMSFGFSLGWNVFYKKTADITEDFYLRYNGIKGIYTINGVQFRYINTVPMMILGRYYFADSRAIVRPYAGFGLGTCWTEYRTDVGQLSIENSRWQFQVAPEIGAIIPINDQFAVNVGARYTYATKAAGGRVPQISALFFNIGIVLTGAY